MGRDGDDQVSELTSRPRQVSIAGLMAVVGAMVGLGSAFSAITQLDSGPVRDEVDRLLAQQRFSSIDVNTALTWMRIGITVSAVLCVVALVLGIFVLRGHRGSRIGLTAVGAVTAALVLLAGIPGVFASAYIAVGVGLLWTRAARSWFAPPPRPPTL
jgi:hypothetical protein